MMSWDSYIAQNMSVLWMFAGNQRDFYFFWEYIIDLLMPLKNRS